MTAEDIKKPYSCHDVAAWILSGCALLLIVKIHLLAALFSGLLVYELTNILVHGARLKHIAGYRARLVAVSFIAVVVVTILTLAIIGLIVFFRGGNESLPVLLEKMAEIIEDSKRMLPNWVVDNYYPPDAESIKIAAVEWLKAHAAGVQSIGKSAGKTAAHILIGMIIGAIISLREANEGVELKPLAAALSLRVRRLSSAFRNIVFAQVRIAFINAFFTWLYLGVALPLMDIHIPLMKTMILITFLVGLLPVLGNLISNTIIVIVSLSYSLPLAMSSLIFLIVIHKLEYFLNAKIIGSRIKAKIWEMLCAMLLMEVLFGIPGLIAAPVYYAYLKEELAEKGLI